MTASHKKQIGLLQGKEGRSRELMLAHPLYQWSHAAPRSYRRVLSAVKYIQRAEANLKNALLDAGRCDGTTQ